MNVLVLGASGFVGTHLGAALRARGDVVKTASLRDPEGAAREAGSSDAVVNLAGEPIGRRWNESVKRAILESRSTAPARFLSALEKFGAKPSTYVSASAVGYYGTSETATFTEQSPAGSDFLAHVCAEWERVAHSAQDLGMRVACIRTGLALGRDGGALSKLLPIFKAGAGGRVASGRQWHSWIHIDDLVGVYLMALDRVEGPLNATAPQPERNAEFTKALARALRRPAALPVPALALRLALGEGAMVLLEGQRVLPERTLAQGYAFKFPALDGTLRDILA